MATLRIYKDGFEFECKKCGIIGNAIACRHFKNSNIKRQEI